MSGMLSVWLVGLASALALVIVVWSVSLLRRDASIIDIFWGPGFVLMAGVYSVLGDGWPPRKLLVVSLVSLWGMRLGAHLFWRNRGKPEDYRYRRMRDRHGKGFAWVSLTHVFLLQGVLMWLISAPLLQAIHVSRPAGFTGFDLAAAALFAVGLTFESVGDWQLARFRADPANRGKVMRRGLWRYTRHPNYFGDAVVWWSFFVLALATPGASWTVFGPLLMTFLLLKVSGVALLEKDLARKPGYADYAASTSLFLPWPPRSSGVSQPSGETR